MTRSEPGDGGWNTGEEGGARCCAVAAIRMDCVTFYRAGGNTHTHTHPKHEAGAYRGDLADSRERLDVYSRGESYRRDYFGAGYESWDDAVKNNKQ